MGESTARPEVLGLVPARGGSKGIPKKNLRELAGRPLVHHTFDAARASTRLTRVIVSTECPEIAAQAEAAGMDVPFLRPPELATDEAPTIRVIEHALDWLKGQGESPDAIVLLQPTTPLRGPHHIDEAVDLLFAENADSVVSVAELPAHVNPHWQLTIRHGRLRVFTGEPLKWIVPRRQELPTTYTRNGAIYAFRRQTVERTGSVYGHRCVPYVMPPEVSVNLDSLDDWRRAEDLLRKGGAPL